MIFGINEDLPLKSQFIGAHVSLVGFPVEDMEIITSKICAFIVTILTEKKFEFFDVADSNMQWVFFTLSGVFNIETSSENLLNVLNVYEMIIRSIVNEDEAKPFRLHENHKIYMKVFCFHLISLIKATYFSDIIQYPNYSKILMILKNILKLINDFMIKLNVARDDSMHGFFQIFWHKFCFHLFKGPVKSNSINTDLSGCAIEYFFNALLITQTVSDSQLLGFSEEMIKDFQKWINYPFVSKSWSSIFIVTTSTFAGAETRYISWQHQFLLNNPAIITRLWFILYNLAFKCADFIFKSAVKPQESLENKKSFSDIVITQDSIASLHTFSLKILCGTICEAVNIFIGRKNTKHSSPNTFQPRQKYNFSLSNLQANNDRPSTNDLYSIFFPFFNAVSYKLLKRHSSQYFFNMNKESITLCMQKMFLILAKRRSNECLNYKYERSLLKIIEYHSRYTTDIKIVLPIEGFFNFSYMILFQNLSFTKFMYNYIFSILEKLEKNYHPGFLLFGNDHTETTLILLSQLHPMAFAFSDNLIPFLSKNTEPRYFSEYQTVITKILVIIYNYNFANLVRKKINGIIFHLIIESQHSHNICAMILINYLIDKTTNSSLCAELNVGIDNFELLIKLLKILCCIKNKNLLENMVIIVENVTKFIAESLISLESGQEEKFSPKILKKAIQICFNMLTEWVSYRLEYLERSKTFKASLVSILIFKTTSDFQKTIELLENTYFIKKLSLKYQSIQYQTMQRQKENYFYSQLTYDDFECWIYDQSTIILTSQIDEKNEVLVVLINKYQNCSWIVEFQSFCSDFDLKEVFLRDKIEQNLHTDMINMDSKDLDVDFYTKSRLENVAPSLDTPKFTTCPYFIEYLQSRQSKLKEEPQENYFKLFDEYKHKRHDKSNWTHTLLSTIVCEEYFSSNPRLDLVNPKKSEDSRIKSNALLDNLLEQDSYSTRNIFVGYLNSTVTTFDDIFENNFEKSIKHFRSDILFGNEFKADISDVENDVLISHMMSNKYQFIFTSIQDNVESIDALLIFTEKQEDYKLDFHISIISYLSAMKIDYTKMIIILAVLLENGMVHLRLLDTDYHDVDLFPMNSHMVSSPKFLPDLIKLTIENQHSLNESIDDINNSNITKRAQMICEFIKELKYTAKNKISNIFKNSNFGHK